MSNVQEIIQVICNEKIEVKLNEHVLSLVRPDWEGSKRVMAEFNKFSEAQAANPTGNIDAGFTVARLSIQACLPDCSEDQAHMLFVASGGFEGELYEKALALCGMKLQARKDVEELDPTSESHEN